MSGATKISVIIPSLADAARAKVLKRAIGSVLDQERVSAAPIVVVNGGRHDPAVIEWLRSQPGVRLVQFSYGGLPEARLVGREAVDSEFFATLDDDDVFLPHALATRLAPMLADCSIDVVVTNGYRDMLGRRQITDQDILRFQSNPLEGLMETNWLNESAGLFRARSVGREFFTNLPPVVEWTCIAFKLAQSRNIRFLGIPTFVKYVSPGSLSHSVRYTLEHPNVLRGMLDWDMSREVRGLLKRKYVKALHQTSVKMLKRRDYSAAWRYHLKSLMHIQGQRYLGYTRHIVSRHVAAFTEKWL